MKAAYRMISHAKRSPAAFSKFFRPKAQEHATTLQIVHWDNLGNMKSGNATREQFWDWLESGYTHSFYINLLCEEGVAISDDACMVIAQQLHSHGTVVDRFVRTGQAVLLGTEIDIAESAARVMDGLITLDRNGAFHRAAQRSDEIIQRMKATVWV